MGTLGRGAAIARLDGLCDQRSGEGVFARNPSKLELEPAAERGRGIGLNSAAVAFRSRGDESGEGTLVLFDSRFIEATRGDEGFMIYEDPSLFGFMGDETGVCGLRSAEPMGYGGAELGVSGLLKRVECVDARDEGRDIGLLFGVRNRNGTPAISSRCLCMRSSTWLSSTSAYGPRE